MRPWQRLKNLGPGRLSESPTGFPNLQQSSAVQHMAKFLTKECPMEGSPKGPLSFVSISSFINAALGKLRQPQPIPGWVAKGSTGVRFANKLHAVSKVLRKQFSCQAAPLTHPILTLPLAKTESMSECWSQCSCLASHQASRNCWQILLLLRSLLHIAACNRARCDFD